VDAGEADEIGAGVGVGAGAGVDITDGLCVGADMGARGHAANSQFGPCLPTALPSGQIFASCEQAMAVTVGTDGFAFVLPGIYPAGRPRAIFWEICVWDAETTGCEADGVPTGPADPDGPMDSEDPRVAAAGPAA